MGNVNVMLGTVLLTQELVKAAPVEVTSKMGSVFVSNIINIKDTISYPVSTVYSL